jgi:hypothetical protein
MINFKIMMLKTYDFGLVNKSKWVLLLLAILLSLSSSLQAQTAPPPSAGILQVITLKDGSVLKGFLKAISGDNYVIQSPTLGTLTVPMADVLKIIPAINSGLPGGNTPAATPPSFEGMVQNIQQDYLSDPAIFSDVQQLSQDQEFVNLILDPKFMETIMSMDPAKIQNHPTVQKLLQDPKVQELMKKIEQKMKDSQSGGTIP